MKKYLAIFLTAAKSTLAWRGHNFVWVVFLFVEIMVYPFVLFAAYHGSTETAGFTKDALITYYFFVPLISTIALSYAWDVIREDVHDGFISVFLSKPFHILLGYYFEDLGERFMRIFWTIILMGILFFFIHPHLHVPPLSVTDFLVIFLLVVLSSGISFLIAAIVGLSAAWTTSANWAVNAWVVITTIAAGYLAPITFYPAWLQTLLLFLPFRLFIQTPLQVLLGQETAVDLFRDVTLGAIWFFLLLILVRLIWKRATYRLEGVGL